MYKNYDQLVLQLRAKLHLTQEELGKMLDVSKETVNRWENGHHEPLKVQKVRLNELFKDNNIN